MGQAERDAKAEWQGKFGSADRDELEEESGEDGEEAETEGDEDESREEKPYPISRDGTEAGWWDDGVRRYFVGTSGKDKVLSVMCPRTQRSREGLLNFTTNSSAKLLGWGEMVVVL